MAIYIDFFVKDELGSDLFEIQDVQIDSEFLNKNKDNIAIAINSVARERVVSEICEFRLDHSLIAAMTGDLNITWEFV